MSSISTDEIINTYFQQNNILVNHQTNSYNDFIDNIIPKIINQSLPINVEFNNDVSKIQSIKMNVHNIEQEPFCV